ncbi:LysE family translocator [Halomonas aquamarina]|uniref:LysE family translocator n=1 Tax=Vreelandella aquamarina TaxID=77097 RepID=A0ACC5VXY4_9GAMM|nr:LysE family translocator [Halomonas aquamarina]MBZ5488379.1 LysE family translocator [Halomonas aquamarina]
MEHFIIIAAAHFLALISPGPDFFLVTRSSLRDGWKVASGACIGIALANGVFILGAFTGVGVLRAETHLFVALQMAGCLYLVYLGILFIRHAGSNTMASLSKTDDHGRARHRFQAWGRAAAMGFLSGILNPKNAIFYVSLAAMLTGPYASTGWKIAYGVWMFSAVLIWDLLVALMIGNRVVLQRFARILPWLERASGSLLLLLAGGVIMKIALESI